MLVGNTDLDWAGGVGAKPRRRERGVSRVGPKASSQAE
jgi:hypothetical protein